LDQASHAARPGAGQIAPAVLTERTSFHRSSTDMELLYELWLLMRDRKKFWLLPLVVVFLVFGALLILTHGSAVAPFIYTIF
jgi:hypothetical protein